MQRFIVEYNLDTGSFPNKFIPNSLPISLCIISGNKFIRNMKIYSKGKYHYMLRNDRGYDIDINSIIASPGMNHFEVFGEISDSNGKVLNDSLLREIDIKLTDANISKDREDNLDRLKSAINEISHTILEEGL